MNKFSNSTQAIYDAVFAKACEEKINITKYGRNKSLEGKSNSRKVVVSMDNPITPSTATLTEGVNPSATDLTSVEVAVSPAIIGGFTEISEELQFSAVNDRAASALKRWGQYCSASVRKILLAELMTSTNSVTLAGKLTFADIQEIAVKMADESVPKIDTPAGEGYIAFVSPKLAGQIRSLNEFRQMNQFTHTDTLRKGEVAMMEGIFFVEVSDDELKTVAVDTDAMVVIGDEAFVTVGTQDDYRKILRDKSLAGGALEMYSTAGAKAHFGCEIFEDKRVYVVKAKTA